jgi:hypothetical protein
MLRRSVQAIRVAIAVSAVLFSTLAHADVESSTVTPDAVRFAELVTIGDRARLARRINDALKAYNNALDIRRDPAVRGRIGLILLELGSHAGAAEHLLNAITKAQAPPYLMRQFHEGFARVRPKVCSVEVFVSEQGADVLIDVDQKLESESNGFHVFVPAGLHTFQAKLKGFEDGIETIDVPLGGELQVRLLLKPLPPPPPPPVHVPPLPNLDTKPSALVKPHTSLSDSYTHFSLGAGLVFVLGAGPGVAVGPQISGGIRRGFFSLNVDTRVAWATGTLERAPKTQLMTWAVGVRPCAHYPFLFGCGVLQVDGLNSASEGFTSQTLCGGGVRGGVEMDLRKPVRLHLWGEGIGHSKGNSVDRNGRGYWQGPPAFGGFGATAFLTW